MKKYVFLAFIALFCVSSSAWAQYVKLTAEDGTISWIPISGTIDGTNIEISSYAINQDTNGSIDLNEVWSDSGGNGDHYQVTSIGEYAFQNCSGLTSVIIPNSVTSIEAEAFYYCTGLTSITIPNSVTSIGWEAFACCRGLTSITSYITDVFETGWDAFYDLPSSATLYVPKGLVDMYKSTADWNRFSNLESYSTDLLDWESINHEDNTTDSQAYLISAKEGDVLSFDWYVSSEDSYDFLTIMLDDNTIVSSSGVNDATYTTPLTAGSHTLVVSYSKNGIMSANNDNAGIRNIKITGNDVPEEHIEFADANVKAICVQNWDKNHDGELSYSEASAVSNIGYVFERSKITSFNELQYFTGLTNIGNYAFEDCTGLTSIVIPSTVTSIGNYAFEDCTGLTSIEIPISVTSIGQNAFYRCRSLTTVTINNNAILSSTTYSLTLSTIFGSQVTKYVLGTNVTSIGSYAFSGCSRLTSIDIPISVTSIGNNAFYGCSSLTSIEIPSSVTSISSNAFEGTGWYKIQPDGLVYAGKVAYKYKGTMSANTSITLEEGTKGIAGSAFQNCSSLTSIIIPSSVTNIGEGAFYRCSDLTSINIPSGVTIIPYQSFSGCESLTTITIPNSVTRIEDEAFYGCSSLTYIDIPSSVTSIGQNAFIYCSGLTSIIVESGNSVYDSRNNCNAIIETVTNTLIKGCNNTIIPSGVTSIASSAFQNCSSLASVIIPSSVTNIGFSAFYNCSGLTSVEIPTSITNIPAQVFYNCSGLTSIEIPNSVTSLGRSAFEGCSGLISIFIPASVSTIDISAFNRCTNLSEIQVDENNTAYCSLDGVLMNKDMTSIILFPNTKEDFVLPASVTSLNPSILGKKIKSFQIVDSDASLTLTDGKFPNIDNIYIGRNITLSNGSYYPFSSVEIQTVVFGSKVTNIPKNLFSGSRLRSVLIPSNVTTINSNAFSSCSSLDKVNYLGTISQWFNISFLDNPLRNGADLYLNDYPISDLIFPNINGTVGTQLRGCTNLKSVSIASGNTSIDQYAFSGCSSLEKITIPVSVGTINGDAFYNCKNLNAVYYNGTLGDWFGMTLTANPLSSGTDLYLNNTLLTNAVIPSSVTQIGSHLRGCTSLETVTISVGATSISDYAFKDCKSLTSVSVPSGVTSIGSYSFGDCISLTGITLPSSVTHLSEYAFSGCSSLQYINFSGSANYTTIDGVVYDKEVTKIITYPLSKTSTTYTYPSTITTFGGISNNPYLEKIYVPHLSNTPSINTNSFNAGENLMAVEFEDYIGDYYTKDGVVYKKYEYNGKSEHTLVFCPRGKKSLTVSPEVRYVDGLYSSSKLESLTIEPSEQYVWFDIVPTSTSTGTAYYMPVNLKYLFLGRQLYGSATFGQSIDLKTVVIGENMTSIPSNLFMNCTSLTQVSLPETITSVGSNAFAGTPWLASLPIQDGVRYYNYIGLEYKYSEETKNVRLKDGTSVVTGGLFEDSSVESVTFPISVTNLGTSLFYGCKSLKKVVLPNSIKEIPWCMYCGAVENIHVPNSVTFINREAINQCDTVVIEDGNGSLRLSHRDADDGSWNGVFSGVKNLYVGRETSNDGSSYGGESFTASNSSTTQLTEVTFGPLVTRAFGGYAFRCCDKVTKVTCLGKTPFTSPTFYKIPQTAVLYVPLGSKQQYESASGWSEFWYIKEVTEVTITMDDTEMVYAGDFDLDFSKIDGLTAYVVSDFDTETSIITLERAQRVSAGKGILLKGAKGKYTVPCTNIEPMTADPLCGTISGRFIRNLEDDNINYVFDNTEHIFKPVDAAYGCLLSRNAAYLSLPASSVSGNGNIMLIEKPCSPGDVNNDGSVDISDVVSLVNFILDSSTTNSSYDVNGDGNIDISDVVSLVNKILGQ